MARLSPEQIAAELAALHSLPDLVATVIGRERRRPTWRHELADARDFFFLGRHAGYPTALEGALKLKEISYLHAEGYPGGELKHGPLAVIEPGCVVVAVATESAAAGEDALERRGGQGPGRHRRHARRRR